MKNGAVEIGGKVERALRVLVTAPKKADPLLFAMRAFVFHRILAPSVIPKSLANHSDPKSFTNHQPISRPTTTEECYLSESPSFPNEDAVLCCLSAPLLHNGLGPPTKGERRENF